MELLKLLQSRRSIRKYAGERISDETLEKILQAGLLAPSSRAIYPVELVAVRDKEMLRRLSECKAAGAAMLKNADAAIVVVGDTAKSDAWIKPTRFASVASVLTGKLRIMTISVLPSSFAIFFAMSRQFPEPE